MVPANGEIPEINQARQDALSNDVLAILRAVPELADYVSHLEAQVEDFAADNVGLLDTLVVKDEQLDQANQEITFFKHIAEYLERRLQERVLAEGKDSLTGLLDMEGMEVEFNKLATAQRQTDRNAEHSVCFFDLDDFGEINKTLGSHDDADEVLKHVSRVLRSRLRLSDLMCRRTGAADEFIVILKDTGPEEAINVIGTMREILARPIEVAGTTVQTHATFAVGQLDLNKTFTEAIRPTNNTVMIAKKAGQKNTVLRVNT